MKMIIERDDGSKVEVREIESIPADAKALILFVQPLMRQKDIDEMERSFTEKTGKRCVVVDGRIQRVLSVKV